MMVRRADDRRLRLVLARPTGWIAGSELPVRRTARRRDLAPLALEMRDGLPDRCERGESLVLLLDAPGGESVLVTGAVAGLVPQGSDSPDLMDRAAVGASVFMRERLRTEKRQRLPDQLISYFEELNAAECEDAVWRALADHALRIVGAHTSLALMRDAARGLLRAPARAADADPRDHRACILWDDRFSVPGLILSEDARRGGTAEFAAPLFGDPATALLAHVPVSHDGVLVLTERREERIFEPEDWDVLRALALQAEMALRRIRLIDSVRSLSLTDPLTGLGNRRHMEVVMAHAWAAARRGEPLVVMALDLDGFKEVNDTRGHDGGDELLCAVAAALRAEARGSDVLVRYGGDEFLVILPGSTVEGAHALAERVRRRLDGRVGISAGVAAYVAEHDTSEALIREADRRLYEAKARGRTPIS
ncbi:MAG TPA: GGDEF domain-containing protein [Longimicrobium sp.]|nr:GGDEF domain-containing protein [Longimicrobium sp.]